MMLYTTLFWLFFIIWLYLLSVLKRAQLTGYYFILGSVGLFGVFIFLGQDYLVWLFSTSLTTVAGFFGNLTGYFSTAGSNSLVVSHGTQTLYLYIDFECSGLIETTAFCGLIAFYPLYPLNERLLLALTGSLYIFIANLLRIFLITTLLYYGGSSYFYLGHSILGRLFFYILVIILYYSVFTRSHIIQKLLSPFEVKTNGF